MLNFFSHKLTIPLIIFVLIICSSNIRWGNNNWKSTVAADGKGYYAYLPATFIYHDLNFSFFDSIEKKYPNSNLYYDYRALCNNKIVDKYFAGTALAIMPFFLTAHAICSLSNQPTDGYSKIYFIAVNIAAIFYLFIALFYLKKILLAYSASNKLISFILIAITFGTNIFYYVVCEPAMSHIYSFAAITMLLYKMHFYFLHPTRRSVFIISILLGIITLIRPINIIVILIAPFISGNKKAFSKGFSYLNTNKLSIILGVMVFLFIVSIQFLIYKIQTGNFWIYSYNNETFNWSNPQLIHFLLSYKKGVFIYTPLIFISLIGLYRLYHISKFQFVSLSVFLFLLVYVLCSWWNWWYGGSFGSRVIIEYLGVIALLIYFSYDALKSKWQIFIYSFLIVCFIVLCQIQTYQYRYYLIHWEKMDKKHYWNVFLHLDKTNNPNADLLNSIDKKQ